MMTGRSAGPQLARRAGLLDRAFLDDYAQHGGGRASRCSSRPASPPICSSAVRWLARLDADYLDHDAGGYFQIAAGARDVLVRAKNAQDGPTPAGNGLLLGVLARLHLMTGERR